jgi:ribosome-associated translation inhibitor RaiA
MKIRIQSFSFHASDELIGLSESTLNKLSQDRDQVKEAQMTLTIDPSGEIERNVCKVKLALPGYHLFASEQCQSFEEAILKASEALKQRLMYCESGDGSDLSKSYRTAS